MRCGHPGAVECWCYLWSIAEAVRRRGNEWEAFVVEKISGPSGTSRLPIG